jgi:hypothetical protein
MNEPKPLASLSSNLLARKGQAAPAMRRQGMMSMMTEATASDAVEANALEDLGWNDMGQDSDYTPGQAGRAGLSPMAVSYDASEVSPQVAPISAKVDLDQVETSVPEVVLQQRALERETAEPAQAAPLPVAAPAPVFAAPETETVTPAFVPKPAPRVANRAAPGSRGKAAFTLRLDADRHLQLRLACALSHRSAQQIVTEALDAYLGSLPLTEQLAAIRTTGKA